YGPPMCLVLYWASSPEQVQLWLSFEVSKYESLPVLPCLSPGIPARTPYLCNNASFSPTIKIDRYGSQLDPAFPFGFFRMLQFRLCRALPKGRRTQNRGVVLMDGVLSSPSPSANSAGHFESHLGTGGPGAIR